MARSLNINRRDFLNGMALGVAAGGSLSPIELLAQNREAYPPALTGLRGNHPGSFEVAHRLAWTGESWPRPDDLTDDVYDLIVVGGGISGLAAAFFYQQRTDGAGRILVLDNHDDFGGHAKRNEFEIDGDTYLCYGGSQSIDTPSGYSRVSSQLLKDVGIDVQRFYDYFDRRFFDERGLGRGLYFSREKYGSDSVQPNALRAWWAPAAGNADDLIDGYPISRESKADLKALLTSDVDYLPDLDAETKRAKLRQTSYADFLTGIVGTTEEVALLFRDTIKGLWGVGWDALSALEAYRNGMPGTQGMGLSYDEEEDGEEEPYIFHFPDGNAGVARALVRKLNPAAVPGRTMEDLVTARVDYGLLDLPDLKTRIRLNSTAVDVRHTRDEKFADVTYVRNDRPCRTRARHVVLACYNSLIPHLCPELPESQARAIQYAEKVPLVYFSMAVRNWRPFAELGYHALHVPQGILMHSFGMDFPVSMGGYEYTSNPDQPTVLHGTNAPTFPGVGLTARDQHIAGRKLMYEKSYADFERDILRQLDGALGPAGFDAERDLADITVNRWPHGYAYEYNDYSDPPDYGPDKGPHIAGRAQLGRISIANSDASAYAYVDGAIDAADRAVREQLA